MLEETLPAVRLNAPPARLPALTGALARAAQAVRAVRLYAPTEARRNRVLYAGWPLIIVGTLPFAAALAAALEIPVGQAVAGALAAWAVAGLPLTAVLFGAVAGAGLRGPSEDAEGPLPLSPRQRAFGALAAASAAFLGNAALVAALVVASRGDAGAVISGIASLGNWGSAAGYAAGAAALAGLSACWLLAAAFTAAFAASHAVLGAVAALIGGALLLMPAAAGIALHLNHAPHLAGPFLAAAVASTAVSAGAAALALARSAPAATRHTRVSWPMIGLLCLLPLSGSLGSWAAFWRSGQRIAARLEPVGRPWAWSDDEDLVRGKKESGLYSGLGGRLLSRTPAGEKTLLAGSRPSLGELVRRGYDGFDRVYSAFYDADGRVWAEVASARQEGQATVKTIWTGMGDGPLTRYATLPYDMSLLSVKGRAMVDLNIYAYEDKDMVPLDPAKPPLLKRQ